MKKEVWVKKEGSNDFYPGEKSLIYSFLIFSSSADEAIYISWTLEPEPNTCPKENDSTLT